MADDLLTHRITFRSGLNDIAFDLTARKMEDIRGLVMMPGDTLTLEVGDNRLAFSTDQWREAIRTIVAIPPRPARPRDPRGG